MDPEKISYQQQREFGEIFNIAVKFIRQNFKVLILSLIYIAGPFILLTSIANVIYSNSITQTLADLFRNKHFRLFDLFNYQYFISFVIAALSNLIITAVVFEFMLLYFKYPTKEITISTVGKGILKDFGKLALTMFVFYLIGIVVIVVFGGISIGLSSVHWGFTIFLVIVLIILLILFGPNLLYLLSTTYLVRVFGNDSVLDSFGKTQKAMKDNFWWTWLLMLCLFVISMIIGIAMNIPAGFVQFMISVTHMNISEFKTLFSILTTITSTLHILLTSFLLIFIAFNHFSLIEKKDGVGLIQRINEIGQSKKQTFDQEY